MTGAEYIGGSSADFDRLCKIQRDTLSEYPWDEFHGFDERAEDERVASYEKKIMQPLTNDQKQWRQEIDRYLQNIIHHEGSI